MQRDNGFRLRISGSQPGCIVEIVCPAATEGTPANQGALACR